MVGNKIAEMNTSVGFNDDKFFGVGYATTAKTFSFFSQDSQNNWQTMVNTFDPVAWVPITGANAGKVVIIPTIPAMPPTTSRSW